jgi:hypothetical protein
LLGFDLIAYVQHLAATSPEILVLSVALSSWHLFSKTCRALLRDAAEFDLGLAVHWAKHRKAWDKIPPKRRRNPHRSLQTESGNSSARPVAADKDPP